MVLLMLNDTWFWLKWSMLHTRYILVNFILVTGLLQHLL